MSCANRPPRGAGAGLCGASVFTAGFDIGGGARAIGIHVSPGTKAEEIIQWLEPWQQPPSRSRNDASAAASRNVRVKVRHTDPGMRPALLFNQEESILKRSRSGQNRNLSVKTHFQIPSGITKIYIIL